MKPATDRTELAVIGCALMTREAALAVACGATSDDFADPERRRAFEAIVRLATSRSPVDAITLSREMAKDGIDPDPAVRLAVAATQSVPDAANVDHYLKVLRDRRRVRALDRAAEDIKRLAQDPSASAETVAEAQARLSSLETGDGDTSASVGQIVATAYGRLESAHENGVTPRAIRTGIASIDNELGGFRPGELILCAARPGGGKSALGWLCALNAALAGERVHFISLEMPRQDLAMRTLSMWSDIPVHEIRSARIHRDKWQELASIPGRLEQLPLTIHDKPRVSIDELRTSMLREFIAGPIGLVVVDYAQLMLGERGVRHGSREQEVASVARGLKLIAREIDAPVLALAQLNRALDTRSDHEPQLSDLRESGALENNADMVTFIHRQWIHDRTHDPFDAKFLVKKNRNGPLANIQLCFDPSTTKFSDAY